MKRLIGPSLICLLALLAPAVAATIAITQGSGTNMATSLDGSSNNIAAAIICGGTTTTPYPTITQCAEVNSSGQLAVAGPVTNAGTFAVQATLNATPSLANGNGVVPTQGGSVLSATNGMYTNILQGNVALTAAAALPVAPSPYPSTAVPITASATGTTAATTATLTNVSGHTTYICGFSIRANATAAATGNATVTGVITATMNFTQWTAPNASGLGVTEEVFSPCVPASAVSTSIAVVSAAPGTGGVVSVAAWGYSI